MVVNKEILDGFQKTEIGLIPKDWLLPTYGEIFDFLTSATYSRAQLTVNDEIKYVHYGDIHTKWIHFLDVEKSELPSIKNKQLKNYPLLKEGDLLVVDASEDYEGIAKSVEVRNIGIIKIISGLHTFLLRDKNFVFANGYKGYIHSNTLVKKQMDILATGIKVYGVSKSNLKLIKIPLPPTKAEQSAIATALNDADKLITELEKLIAKKKLIKQGTMQELLRPKAGWIEVQFFEIVEKFIDYRGVTPKKLGMDWGGGEIPALSANNVQMGFIDFEKECYFAGADLYKRWMRNGDCTRNDILMTMEAPLGNIAFIPDDKKYLLSQRTVLIKPIDSVDKVFLRYLMMNETFQKKLSENASGSTALGIQRQKLEMILLSIPNNKSDQTRIATILSDIDIEIRAFEKKLDKYKMIKQGMMQNLLTGKIRLV